MHNKFFFFLKKAHLLDTKNFMVYLLAKQKNEGSNLLSFLHFFFPQQTTYCFSLQEEYVLNLMLSENGLLRHRSVAKSTLVIY